MTETNQIALLILSIARCYGPKGVTISEISQEILDSHICNWPDDGSIPSHTGGIWFKEAIQGLIDLHFVVVEGPALQNNNGRAPGFFGMDGSTANDVLVKLTTDFNLLQSVLGFSLSEQAHRTENSVIASPAFSLRRPTEFDVFTLMPFSADLRNVYASVIQPVCDSRSLKCGRGDDFYGSNYIIDEIWTAIFHTSHLIADCTNQNPNVFYELGIAHLLGKDVLIIAQSEADIPFDLRHRRFTIYNTTPDGLARIRTSIEGYLDSTPSSRIAKKC